MKRTIAFVCSGALLVMMIVVFLIFRSRSAYQLLTINVDGETKNTTVRLYDNTSSQEILEVKNIKTTEQIKVKNNEYIVSFSGEDYETQSIAITIHNAPKTININPAYNEKKLAELMEEERADIFNEINRDLPEVSNGYVVEPGKLYKLGQWYGTQIHLDRNKNNDQGYIDTFRIVLKKAPNGWTLVTSPPELILSKIKYPKIPSEILDDVNQNYY